MSVRFVYLLVVDCSKKKIIVMVADSIITDSELFLGSPISRDFSKKRKVSFRYSRSDLFRFSCIEFLYIA